MKTKRYAVEQIVAILKQAEAGIPVKDLCRQHGFSEASYYLWHGGRRAIAAVTIQRRLRPLQ